MGVGVERAGVVEGWSTLILRGSGLTFPWNFRLCESFLGSNWKNYNVLEEQLGFEKENSIHVKLYFQLLNFLTFLKFWQSEDVGKKMFRYSTGKDKIFLSME